MEVARELVSRNQTAFMLERTISDKTMLAYEMLHGFGRVRTPKKVYLSIDLMKVFDTLRWDAIMEILKALGLSPTFRDMIYKCITSASSMTVEGSSTRHINNQRGLRQGNPISHILFNLVMDVLRRLLLKGLETKEFFFF